MGFSSAEVGGVEQDRIYVSHGYAGVDTGDLRAYDIDTNTWLTLASSENIRSEGVGVSHGGMLYCLGGRNTSVLDLVEAYDPSTNSWTTLPSMNTARAGLAASVVGNRIYTFGGNTDGFGPCNGPGLHVAEVYDISSGIWTSITAPPIVVTHAVSVEKGGNIYLFGGCSDGTTAISDTQIYDPVTDTWSVGAPMPTARASMAVGVLGNTIYAIAGWDGTTGNLDAVEAYNRNKDTWSIKTAKPRSVSEVFAASHNGKLYVPGSGAFGASSAVNEIFSKK
nr:kelch repeat-containing protein [Moritella sp.]